MATPATIDIDKLPKLVKPLQKLNRMIGIEEVKTSVLDFILYFLQNKN